MLYDRRFALRKSLVSQLYLISEDGSQWPAKSDNLSLSGMQVCVNKETVDHLISLNKLPIEFHLTFVEHPQHQLNCRLVVNRRRSYDDFLLGVNFLNTSAEQDAFLEQLINPNSHKYFVDSE